MRVNMLSVIHLIVFATLLFKTITCSSTEFVIEGSRICTVVTAKYYDYDIFRPLSDITDITLKLPIGYVVKVPITMTTEYGDIHIILAETDSLFDNNRCYEFALGGWGNHKSEIRRKDNVHEVFDLVENTFAEYIVPLNKNISIELSVSASGVVKVLDLDTQFEFQLIDAFDVIPVKYIAFAGYIGHKTKYTFNCSIVPETVAPLVPSRGFSLFSSRPTCVIFFNLLSSLLLLFGA